VVSAIIDYPIKTPKEVWGYQAPDPEDEYRFAFLRRLIERFKGKRLVGMHIHDAFNYPYYLMGMENLFVAMFEDAKAVHKLVDISVEHNIALARKAVSLGADFILLGDDYGGGNQLLVSPAKFREFFLPGLKKVVGAVKETGAFCFKHCCGDINEILDDMVDTGIDVLHPLDPSANMDITAVKERYPNLVVMGGINCYEPLCAFSEKEIAAETKRVIGTVGRNGRFILASSNSVHSDVKPENYRIVQQVRRETPLSYDE
jgi:uroporphyrinogen decarboxylase